jgi:serine/threonine protein kinase
MVTYLPPQIFKATYPNDEKIKLGCGMDGTVFRCKNFAIKIFNTNELTLFKEISYYTLFDHENIIKPINWTYNEFGYLAFPLGIPLKEAYTKNLISIDQIITDTLSAVTYMTSLGVNHSDLNLKNMLYHNNKVKIIDLGSARLDGTIGAGLTSLIQVYLELHGTKRDLIFLLKIRGKIVSFYENFYCDEPNHPFLKEVAKIGVKPIRKLKFGFSPLIGNIFQIKHDKIFQILESRLAIISEKYTLKPKAKTLTLRILTKFFDKMSYTENINLDLLIFIVMRFAIYLCINDYDVVPLVEELIFSGVTNEDCQQILVIVMRVCGGRIFY